MEIVVSAPGSRNTFDGSRAVDCNGDKTNCGTLKLIDACIERMHTRKAAMQYRRSAALPCAVVPALIVRGLIAAPVMVG